MAGENEKARTERAGGGMDGWAWAVLLKPLYFIVVWVLFIWPVTWAVRRYMPDGKIKEALLRRRGEKPATQGER